MKQQRVDCMIGDTIIYEWLLRLASESALQVEGRSVSSSLIQRTLILGGGNRVMPTKIVFVIFVSTMRSRFACAQDCLWSLNASNAL